MQSIKQRCKGAMTKKMKRGFVGFIKSKMSIFFLCNGAGGNNHSGEKKKKGFIYDKFIEVDEFKSPTCLTICMA